VLVVVGVHSAKFLAEKSTEAIRDAVLRYGVEHPVVNDRSFRLWSEYAIHAWPTLVFVGPQGKVVGKHEGEFLFDDLDRAIGAMVKEFDAKGLLDHRPLHFRREAMPTGPLLYPGKVLADAASGRLFVADSGHNRVVVASLDGQVRLTVGGGERNFRDGGLDTAAFHDPQGLALDGEALYVADTGNHAVRRVDLVAGQVTTVAGSGAQAMLGPAPGTGTSVDLNSPWDLAVCGGILYVAMAGFHQIWTVDPATGRAAPYAGNSREALVDGPLPRASFAQPSGVSVGGDQLYVADSEVSAVRAVDLAGDRRMVRTLVGEGLFDFGDEDGRDGQVRLQHPLGVCFDPARGVLYVADTYNHKVKRLDPRTTETRTFLGSGEPGRRDGRGTVSEFKEPSGLSLAGDRLYVADTNNHAIRVVDLTTEEVTTLPLAER